MGCCSGSPGKWSPEYTKKFKPENNKDCCGSQSQDCSTPSNARENSVLWEWEQTHGKLITSVTFEQDGHGHTVQVIRKFTCPLPVVDPRAKICTSMTYRISR